MTSPSLSVELALLERFETVIGVDEVGRGALAGPVAVGAAAFSRQTETAFPSGLKDSKLLSEVKREALAPLVQSWLPHSVGYSSVDLIEAAGITKALEQAAVAAITPLISGSTVVLLDGSHNWLALSGLEVEYVVRVKADRDCAVVSAAALVAKVQRDQLMRELHELEPYFGFAGNKGYSSEQHIAALREYGPSNHHRKSWLTKILSDENALF